MGAGETNGSGVGFRKTACILAKGQEGSGPPQSSVGRTALMLAAFQIACNKAASLEGEVYEP